MKTFYARKTTIKLIDNKEANSFIAINHTQGAASGAGLVISLGLFSEDVLLGVAQFCAPRTSAMKRRYSIELLRLAFKKNTRVTGGASKLVNHYRRTYRPADLFTYQDATGELTDVYEHCGFILVSQAKKKEYLVAPGKTLTTGTRKEVLGVPYVVQYGPDRILGTKLGEVFDPETGKRKSNKRIFIEDLGWHVEETVGDRVYEWVNPNMTFYTYKITATDSDKYYFGVSHVKMGNATVADCLNDGYFGSGRKGDKANKFYNWKKKHEKTLVLFLQVPS